MKAKLLALASLASLFFLNGCNCIGDKDTILARIGNEKVYQEDYVLLMKDPRLPEMPRNQLLYENFFSKAALTSKALKEFPELEREWKDIFKEVELRILATVYLRHYVYECLMNSDRELRQFYDTNRALFEADSGDFLELRSKIATLFEVSKHKEEFLKFVEENNNPGKGVDTLLLQRRFVDKLRQELIKKISGSIREEQHVKINEFPEVTPKNFYERHKDMFMTVPGYEVYHIQNSDSLILASLFESTPSLELFKQTAVIASKNEFTAKDSGYVGYVKKDYALPYGIGMVSGLSDIEGKAAGYVTPVLRSDKGTFHLFYLVKQVPTQLKPFDRVEAGIASGLKSGLYYDIDSSFVLISKDGKPLLTERELLEKNQKYYKRNMNASVHANMVNMMADRFALFSAAEKLRLNHSWEYRSMVRTMRLNFISDRYLEKLSGVDAIPDEQVRALYDKIGNPRTPGLSFDESKDELKLLLAFPQSLYKRMYYMEYQLSSVGKTFEQTMYDNYVRLNSEYRKVYGNRLAAQAYAEGPVYLYDSSIPEYKEDFSLAGMTARADSLNRAGNWRDAVEQYRNIMLAYADNDSVFEKVSYECAYILSENNENWGAEMEYYAFYKMWPNSVNAEKALFSRGFILNENLHRDADALAVLEEFLQKYPNSELKESAQWLVDNIKSNGKLADDLMKKIEAEE